MNTEYTHISNKDYIIKDDNGILRTVNIFNDNKLIEDILLKENEKEEIEKLIQKEYDNIVNIKNNNTINKIVDIIAITIATSIITFFYLSSSGAMSSVIIITLISTLIIDKFITSAFLDTKKNRNKNINISESKIKKLDEKLKSIKSEIRTLKNKADFKENNCIKIPNRRLYFKKLDLSKQEDISTYEEELNKQFKPKTRTRNLRKK